jgi:hypothetical protein
MADIKTKYGTPAALAISVSSLASDSTLLIGRESALVDNTSGLYLDYLIAGKISTNGSSAPTVGTVIEVWAWGSHDEATTFPDTITGADTGRTLTSRDIIASGFRPVASMVVDTTTGRGYPFGPVALASLYGGVVPMKWGLWVVHNTGQTLNATGGNHYIKVTPVYAQAA